ncbi:MAG: helix-turn-helix domain-containing protein [Thermacetogeniaceae bacterium]
MPDEGNGFGPPWSWQPSLRELTEEAGVDFDEFLRCLRDGAADEAMAQKFNISVQTIANLREHFERYGIDSVIGQD